MRRFLVAVALIACTMPAMGQDDMGDMFPDQEGEKADIIRESDPLPVNKDFGMQAVLDKMQANANTPLEKEAVRQERDEIVKQATKAAAQNGAAGPRTRVIMEEVEEPLEASRCNTVCKIDRASRTNKCETFCHKVETAEEAVIDIAKFARGEPDAGSNKII